MIDKLKKLYELATRSPLEGERNAAMLKLEKLVEKYGVDIDQLSDKPKLRVYKFSTVHEKRLFTAILSDIQKSSKIKYYTSKKLRKSILVDLTDACHIELSYRYEIYKSAWKELLKKETEVLIRSFILRNNIGHSDGKTDDNMPSEEELRELMKIMKRARYLSPTIIRKAINE